MDFYKKLSVEQWAALIPFGIACAAVGYGTKTILDKKLGIGKVNPSVKKNEPKVVDMVDIEDIGNKAVFCRCWRSKKFPYCDGSHNKYNESCDDNTGPLIIQKK
ncbi:CDGSH iron sulfur domain 2 [Oratosquilla oratoria]|uniref:CDGSH iron sulfur domain 2 n=1 Tax=Oratosquilla oratoria TaxID=337810 RepID=UPI003F776837